MSTIPEIEISVAAKLTYYGLLRESIVCYPLYLKLVVVLRAYLQACLYKGIDDKLRLPIFSEIKGSVDLLVTWLMARKGCASKNSS